MAPTTLADSRVQSALRHGVHALKRVANYVLPAALDRRLQELGENKEYLGAGRTRGVTGPGDVHPRTNA